MREIELASWKDLSKRVDGIVKSLEIIYQVKLSVDLEEIPLERVYPTEDFLENDKLALVFKKTVEENYDVPITVVNSGRDYFVLDGHHRAFICKKLMYKTIKAHVLRFPEGKTYREISRHPLEDLRIKDISPIEDPILKAWQRILFVAEHYEAIYNLPFYLSREKIDLKDLVPTQSQVGRTQIDAITKVLVPIVCIRYGRKCYVLDGHARSLRAKELGLDSIEAMILLSKTKINFGIVKTAEDMGLSKLEDVKVMDGLA
jgi:IMP dehydrogenase